MSEPILGYINSNVYSDVGNSSENKESLSAEEFIKKQVEETMNTNIKRQLICGAISFIGNLMGYFFVGLISVRAIYNFKKKYFSIILSQEQGWFDSTNAYEFSTKIQTQLEYIEQGLGEILVLTINDTFRGIASIIFAFLGSWKLSLVLLCFVPLLLLLTIFLTKVNSRGNKLIKETWEKAGSIGEEIFYNIKTVASFSNFDYELKRFYEKVEISNKIELKINCISRIFIPLLDLLKNLVIFVAFIYGRTLIKKDLNWFRGRDISGGDIVLSFNCMMGFYNSVLEISNNIQFITLALIATSDYFKLYERIPKIDLTNSKEMPPLEEIKGNIEFRNVEFFYPGDKNKKKIIKGINLNFEAGKK